MSNHNCWCLLAKPTILGGNYRKVKKEILSIKTERLLLREIVESDLQNIYNGLSNPLVIKHYGVSYDSLEDTKEQMVWYEKPAQFWWAKHFKCRE